MATCETEVTSTTQGSQEDSSQQLTDAHVYTGSTDSLATPSLSNDPLSSSDVDTITPVPLGEICVKSSEDKMGCMVFGMTLLPPGRLVLADFNNLSVKLIDVNSKSIISQLSLGTDVAYSPWDITPTTSTQVAVTVPYSQHIQFISVSSDKLSKSHTIQTDGICAGICYYQDKLIVTYWYPGKLEILDMTGHVITRVTTDPAGKDIFNEPLYVQVNDKSIYVSDMEVNTVFLLNWEGDITGRITDIQSPTGLVALDDGSLLVCDQEQDRMYQVVGDGTNSQLVLQEVSHLYSVCVDEGEHKLYISKFAKENEPDNNILMYKI